jgi:phage tail-like protein
MADYPLSSFHFLVEWGGTRLGFAEVSGLSMETEVIEYREGADKEIVVRKLPGLRKFSNITLKRGMIRGDIEFFQWMNTHNQSSIERRDITISLLNENHEPVLTWKIRNAFPIKLEGPVLNASANEVAIETLEIAHEGLSIVTSSAKSRK